MSTDRYDSAERPYDGRSRSYKDENPEGNTLYVSSLLPHCTPNDLKTIFDKFGSMEDCRVIVNPVTKESRGFGFVSFKNSKDADEAIRQVDGREFDGKIIRVEKAKRNRPHEPTPGQYRGASVKYDKTGRLKPGYSRRRSEPRGYEMSRSDPRDDPRGYGGRDDRDRYYDDYYRYPPRDMYDSYGYERRDYYRDRRSRSRDRDGRRERVRERSVSRDRDRYYDRRDRSHSLHRRK